MKPTIKKPSEFLSENDLWLIVFFSVHIAYIALSIFLPLAEDHEKNVLDVVMRTSAAVLVGYFISKSFATRKPDVSAVDRRVRLRIQSGIVGAVGLFAITMITLVRYCSSLELPYHVIIQLRDFYLASIAFLMGTSGR